MPLRSHGAALAAATTLLVASALPAAAIEADAVAKALGTALIKDSNVEATYTAAQLDGANVVIDGFSVSRGSADQTIVFERVVVEAPTEDGKGLFQSPRIAFTGGTLSGDTTGSVAAATLTEVTVFDAMQLKAGTFAESILFHTAEATDLRFTRKAEPGEMTVARIAVEAGNVIDNIAQDSKGVVENAALSSDFFTPGGFTPATIGYETLAFDVTWDGSRDVVGKTMTIRDFTLTVRDGGEFSIAGVMGNLPDPRILNDAGAASRASQAEVHSLTVRYDDHSLAGRILDALAEKQGLSRAEYAQQISAALPFLLLALNNPAFQGQVSTALTGFLNDPQSLTIRIEPEAPVSGDQIMELVKSAPGSLPDRLKASVTANSPE